MDTTYDPSDQFFQAFRAGALALAAVLDYEMKDPAEFERSAWAAYIDFLHEDGITAAAL